MASKGIEQFHADVLAKNPVLILLEFGANEFLRNFSLNTARNNIDLLIKTIKSKNINVVFLNFIHPDMLNRTTSDNPLIAKSELAIEYYEMIKNVSASNDILVIEYIYKNIWENDKLMSSDGLHPNNKGNAQLRKNVFDALFSTFENNDMLK